MLCVIASSSAIFTFADQRTAQLLVDGREMIGVMTDTKIIRPCIVGWSKISRFCELDNIGKYFKRVDRSGRLLRFTMAEDHKKLYPDD